MLDIYPFRCDKFNKIYINGLEIDEILTYVSMYGGYSTSILRYGCPNSDVTFSDPYFGLKTHFCHFPTRRAYFFFKLKFRIFLTFIVLQRF